MNNKKSEADEQKPKIDPKDDPKRGLDEHGRAKTREAAHRQPSPSNPRPYPTNPDRPDLGVTDDPRLPGYLPSEAETEREDEKTRRG